jgi:NAD+ kinase
VSDRTSGAKPRAITVFTHQYPGETAGAIRRLIEVATEADVEVRLSDEEVEKHQLPERPGVVFGADPDGDVDLAVVLGGDGTILRALRTFAGTRVPVFAFNFGAIGFLSTVDHDELEEGLRRAIEGDYDLLRMPALVTSKSEGEHRGVNDISFHRRQSNRVAELGYSVSGERLGQVRCDGLVASTPVGSTGYNLANGGPVLAWGVEGFVVSFIAPHTLTARALVVAPGDPLSVINLSDRDPVDVTTDGRPVAELGPGAEVDVRFEHDQVLIAQVPGSSFYHRLRDKFGRLAY